MNNESKPRPTQCSQQYFLVQATMPWTAEDLKAVFAKYAGADNAMTKEEFLNLAKAEFPDAGVSRNEMAHHQQRPVNVTLMYI